MRDMLLVMSVLRLSRLLDLAVGAAIMSTAMTGAYVVNGDSHWALRALALYDGHRVNIRVKIGTL